MLTYVPCKSSYCYSRWPYEKFNNNIKEYNRIAKVWQNCEMHHNYSDRTSSFITERVTWYSNSLVASGSELVPWDCVVSVQQSFRRSVLWLLVVATALFGTSSAALHGHDVIVKINFRVLGGAGWWSLSPQRQLTKYWWYVVGRYVAALTVRF